MNLSIITINYNDHVGLRKTIESVKSQSYINIEYVVIDGRSTDASLEVIATNRNFITYWISEPDSGIYNAMNKGLKNATGEYVLFLNSGDILAHNTVIEQVISLLTGEDIIYGNLSMQENSGSWTKSYPAVPTLSYLFEDSLPHSGSLFIKKTAFKNDLSLYDETLQIVSDWKWTALAIFKHNYTFKHIDMVVSIFDRAGVSSKPENLALLNNEKKLVLRDCFPLLKDDMERLIKYKNDYQLLMASRYLKFCLSVKKLLLKKLIHVQRKSIRVIHHKR